jgi:hypothetical protein
MFKRTADTSLFGSKELYNLRFNETSYMDTTLPLGGQQSVEDDFAVAIYNYDDKPIDIQSVNVRFYADEIVFESAPGETYTLDFGADAAKSAPIYDIASYQTEILSDSIDPATIGAVSYVQTEEPPEPQDYSLVFNIVVTVCALFLGGLVLFRLKRNGDR